MFSGKVRAVFCLGFFVHKLGWRSGDLRHRGQLCSQRTDRPPSHSGTLYGVVVQHLYIHISTHIDTNINVHVKYKATCK